MVIKKGLSRAAGNCQSDRGGKGHSPDRIECSRGEEVKCESCSGWAGAANSSLNGLIGALAGGESLKGMSVPSTAVEGSGPHLMYDRRTQTVSESMICRETSSAKTAGGASSARHRHGSKKRRERETGIRFKWDSSTSPTGRMELKALLQKNNRLRKGGTRILDRRTSTEPIRKEKGPFSLLSKETLDKVGQRLTGGGGEE